MNADEVKQLLQEIRDDPSILDSTHDLIDKALLEVIAIERRHLYALETSSAKKRQDEIRKILDRLLPAILEEKCSSDH